MPRYVPGTVPVTDDIQQLERFLRDETEQIRNATDDIYEVASFSVDTFNAAGYGGIYQGSAGAPLADINASYQTVNTMDLPVIDPRGTAYNFANHSVAVDAPGVWYFTARLTVQHNEDNAGRVIALRRYNLTTGQPGVVYRFGVGRDSGVTNMIIGAFGEVENAYDEYVLQVGSDGDVFTGVSAIGALFELHSVSEYKGNIIQTIEGAKARWR